ncbi:MAG: hypothetical protein DIZ80_06705 [endosymbiont of Galathealinum brachiosum]|uniref:SCO family protein n=1 Tax=endosymbiont of Galathealinum brachiosum TaxID=2200906 RepID=A0A370DG62_9GAMM|nr:MAG: hypothetical protein DIZ80_06705 [endosymbiont of Galathealinum brachiosum]
MKKQQSIILAISALIAASAGIWMGQQNPDTQLPRIKPAAIQGAIYPAAKTINDFSLVNQHSEKITKDNFIDHWSLIFVGYTHCPDICPTTMTVMNQVSEFMQQQKIQPPRIVFLSIDPLRDTSESLKSYVTYFNKDFIGLTGSVEEVTKLSKQLNAVFRKSPGASGEISNDDYLMDHSSALMLINPQGNLQSILTAPHTPGNIIESIIKSQAYYKGTH